MASGSGLNLWVWLAGGGCGWNLWVWLVGVVVRRYIYTCIYRFPLYYNNTYPYSSCIYLFYLQQHGLLECRAHFWVLL